jgi:hypothetical protein
MKRSSSITALHDSSDIKLGKNKPSYCEENVLVTSMMHVTIEDESRREKQLLRKQRSNGSMNSMSGMSSISGTSSFSRSSSRGSLRGWGSNASRKSYKVDLCSLALDDFHGEITTNHLVAMPTKNRRKFPAALALQKGRTSSKGNSSVANHALDSWGFFLE